jgi:hypothetical protein
VKSSENDTFPPISQPLSYNKAPVAKPAKPDNAMSDYSSCRQKKIDAAAAATASGDHRTTKGNHPPGRRGWCLMKMPKYTVSKLCMCN